LSSGRPSRLSGPAATANRKCRNTTGALPTAA
jgi:hypothetical protein